MAVSVNWGARGIGAVSRISDRLMYLRPPWYGHPGNHCDGIDGEYEIFVTGAGLPLPCRSPTGDS